jgi:hypothetical protein
VGALTRGLYGANIELRQERALEFIETIRNNPTIFTQELLKSQQFQDGFVYTFEKYLQERSEAKRKIIQQIFKKYSIESSKESFELERYVSTLQQVSVDDLVILEKFMDGSARDWQKKQYPHMTEEELDRKALGPLNEIQISMMINGTKDPKYADGQKIFDPLLRLSTLNLLYGPINPNPGKGIFHGLFKVSTYGKDFVRFLKSN